MIKYIMYNTSSSGFGYRCAKFNHLGGEMEIRVDTAREEQEGERFPFGSPCDTEELDLVRALFVAEGLIEGKDYAIDTRNGMPFVSFTPLRSTVQFITAD